MTAPTVYRSTDASAPVLSGTVGSLNTLLLACLVDGYGAKAGAGWTRPYYDAATHQGMYRMGAGNQHYLHVNDNGPGAHGGREARCRGYVTASSYSSGTEPFPTAAQYANGLFFRKSATADSTPRAWTMIADAETMYLMISAGDSGSPIMPYYFGAFLAWKTSDNYDSILSARIVEGSASNTSTQHPGYCAGHGGYNVLAGYSPRGYLGVSGAVAIYSQANGALSNVNVIQVIGGAGQPYPFPVDGGLLLSPLWLLEGVEPRGRLRGLWVPGHTRPLAEGDTYSVSDGAITRSFLALNNGSVGQIHFETSDTWDLD